MPGTAIWYEMPFVAMGSGGQGDFLLAAAVITALSSLAILFFLFVWIGVLEKKSDPGVPRLVPRETVLLLRLDDESAHCA